MSNMITVGKYTFFYDKTCPPSNWYMMDFTIKGYKFNCGEQAMMFSKAMLFGDKEIADQILAAKWPGDHKALGRKVKGYVEEVWVARRSGIQDAIVFARFDQNPKERLDLFKSLDTLMVEAAKNDKIWGIGLGITDSRIHDKTKWQGLNLLGESMDRGKARLILKYPEEYAAVKAESLDAPAPDLEEEPYFPETDGVDINFEEDWQNREEEGPRP
jgi:ribA/ribD-fused uncharacterized protein